MILKVQTTWSATQAPNTKRASEPIFMYYDNIEHVLDLGYGLLLSNGNVFKHPDLEQGGPIAARVYSEEDEVVTGGLLLGYSAGANHHVFADNWPAPIAVRILQFFCTSEKHSVIFDLPAYLMNNEGKTIDRFYSNPYWIT